MEGISIGSVKSTVKSDFKRMPERTIKNASAVESSTEIAVAVIATLS